MEIQCRIHQTRAFLGLSRVRQRMKGNVCTLQAFGRRSYPEWRTVKCNAVMLKCAWMHCYIGCTRLFMIMCQRKHLTSPVKGSHFPPKVICKMPPNISQNPLCWPFQREASFSAKGPGWLALWTGHCIQWTIWASTTCSNLKSVCLLFVYLLLSDSLFCLFSVLAVCLYSCSLSLVFVFIV